ncbi:hypothetical protein A2V56_04290 [Candidatus Woesebacteria bacterium RBG_19FT_COMBO_42_9]|uniref:Uncharacterized protein n=1 Tax=Candidatus Woesebacteria bacterium RBG_16_42_24 TaxID=1802485 RepID=A0A1F7XJN4_9BACT|nr:MAG: hypothetical protein A2V97_01075 [Candidatus Woesebacteria bacterium RBG_16_42_24]OGM17836.1 MAG: hypothetical protein A2V56_04290 [Candidatus Woesebacteria bacterium RBG_19FT_COMBO_42_9]OGM68111.1 MAG: hypothetical protein A2985_03535 [Candidatus Woesebacteria bacterium RIFCSPLOWO2_01_FULL_43_11]
MKNPGLYLKVRNRELLIFDGPVKSVTSFNDKGFFDVLPQHANFISLIRRLLAFRDTGDQKREIKFDSAIMRVYRENIDVYLGIKR